MADEQAALQTAPHRAQVYSAYAKHQFDQGNYIAAAQSYSQSATSFEQITLAFLDLGEQGRDGLRSYLYARLERCGKGVRGIPHNATTWMSDGFFSFPIGVNAANAPGNLAGRVLS